jgi:hypothetical protein
VLDRLLRGVVPLEVVVTVGEVDVVLVEDGCPLEGCSYNLSVCREKGVMRSSKLTVLCLTCCAMAELAVERLTTAQLVLNLTAVAVGFVLDIKVINLLVVHAVRWALLPLRNACRRLAAALVLIHSS